MLKIAFFVFIFGTTLTAFSQPHTADSKIPAMLTGTFQDDYGIKYKITDSSWTQLPGTTYHIISWNVEQQYVVAKNDNNNPSDKGLFTRIDFMKFSNMEPFKWGFCLTEYKAPTIKQAIETAAADRSNPKKGCNGYPFSRMKRI